MTIGVGELEQWGDGESWPPANAGHVAQELLENFASPDPRVRDTLSFTLMERLVAGGFLTLEEQVALLRTSLDDRHLLAGIGESGTDRVFQRSFSVLMVPMILESDIGRDELPEDLVAWTLDRVLTYARAERDWRGYIVNKGWAHAVAHTADALASVACHPKVPVSRVPDVLSAIHHLATIPYPLGYLEDDRLALAAYQILESGGLTVQTLLDNFRRLTGPDEQAETLGNANAEHFLRSLYFRFRAKARNHVWLDAIQVALDRFDIFLLYPPPDATF